MDHAASPPEVIAAAIVEELGRRSTTARLLAELL